MKDCCYLRIEDVSVGNNAFDHPDYRYTCELFNKRIFYGICKGCEHYKVKMVKCGVCGASMRYQKWGKHVKIYCYSQQSSKPKLIRNPNCDNYKNDSDEIEKAVIDDLLRRTENIVGVKDVKDTSISAISILNNKKII